MTDDRIEIAGTGILAPGQKIRTDLTEFSRVILDTVVDSATLNSTNGRPAFNLVKSRRS